MARLILNSRGLNTRAGTLQIKKSLGDIGEKKLSEKSIYIVSFPEYAVDELIRENCETILGFKPNNIYFSGYKFPDNNFTPDIIYVGEGNTFEVLQYMRKYGITQYIKNLIEESRGEIYVGSSAGAIIAGTDIMLARDFDSNYVGMVEYSALGLFEGTIIPHYTSDELKRYISNTEVHILRRYSNIFSVCNEEAIVINKEKEEKI